MSLNFETKQIICDAYEIEYKENFDKATINEEFEMNIVLKSDQPISFQPRRLSYADKEKVQVILDDLLEKGVIRPSSSPYASAIVLTHKKNGEIRLCVDYRELNKITVKDNYPTPLIEDNIDQLKDKKYFSGLDLRDGFYHVKMAESSVKYTFLLRL